jgi:hypothetical protein
LKLEIRKRSRRHRTGDKQNLRYTNKIGDSQTWRQRAEPGHEEVKSEIRLKLETESKLKAAETGDA